MNDSKTYNVSPVIKLCISYRPRINVRAFLRAFFGYANDTRLAGGVRGKLDHTRLKAHTNQCADCDKSTTNVPLQSTNH